MLKLKLDSLEGFGVAADSIERFFSARSRKVAGSLAAVVDVLRRGEANFRASVAGQALPRLALSVRSLNAEPDVNAMLLAEGQMLGAALEYFGAPCRSEVQIDDTLLTRELCNDDGRFRWLDGARTIVFGFRLHAEAGGEMRLFGNQEAGRDLLWTPPGGHPVSVECKNREWDALWKDPEKWRTWALQRLRAMRDGLQCHPPLRIAILHIPANPVLAEGIQNSVDDFMEEVQGNVDYVGGLSGVGIMPTAYGVSPLGQAVAVSRGTYVDLRNPKRRIEAPEEKTRAILARRFSTRDPPVHFLKR